MCEIHLYKAIDSFINELLIYSTTHIFIKVFLFYISMPNISVYLPNDLYELVKANPSKIIQEALRQSINKNKEQTTSN